MHVFETSCVDAFIVIDCFAYVVLKDFFRNKICLSYSVYPPVDHGLERV